MRTALLVIVVLASASEAFGQYPGHYQPTPMQPGPRERRAARERAVAQVGPSARSLVEAYDSAAAALFTCSRATGQRLAEFHNAGDLAKFPRPDDLLRVIAQPGHGDDVANWVMLHANELTDKDCFDAFMLNPLEHSLNLKELSASTAELRARRQNQLLPGIIPAPAGGWDWRLIGGTAAVLGLILLLYWRKRRQSS